MFDFRYHVVSLAAVFFALVIGILVGVGIAGRGVVDKADRQIYQNEISQLQADLDAGDTHVKALEQKQQATATLIQQAYPALMSGRLAGKRVAVLVVGRDDGSTGASVDRALHDAGALGVVRYRALKVPVDAATLGGPLVGHKQLASYAGESKLGRLGSELGRELVHGGKTPLWDALSGLLVEERRDAGNAPADAVVVIRAVEPQGGDTGRLLTAIYGSLASAGVPAVGVEATGADPTAIPAFMRADLSTVNDVDEPLGRLALALLLAGGSEGNFGLGKETAPDGVLPPVVPLEPAVTTTGA
ncbi:MAG TPA: copper transporter [Gaiellaceae bacterium]|nr:copper transporter [Gaiellaceae bacterium]